MKKLSHWIPRNLFLIIFGCSFGLATGAWAADGLVLNFQGDVRVNGQPVSDETELNRGDKITTGPGASLTIVLSDKSVLDIKANSEIDLSDYIYNESDHSEDTYEVGLVEGTLRYVSGLMGKSDPDKIRFRAGASTIGVRGSYTSFSFNENKVTADASIGSVKINFPSGRFCMAKAGQSCTGNLQAGNATVIPTPVPDDVDRVAKLIAGADFENPKDVAAIRTAIRDLGKKFHNLPVLLAVQNGNSEQLGINTRTTARTVIQMGEVFPDKRDKIATIALLVSQATCGCKRDRDEDHRRSGDTGHES